jgi:hypothetical protein
VEVVQVHVGLLSPFSDVIEGVPGVVGPEVSTPKSGLPPFTVHELMLAEFVALACQ